MFEHIAAASLIKSHSSCSAATVAAAASAAVKGKICIAKPGHEKWEANLAHEGDPGVPSAPTTAHA